MNKLRTSLFPIYFKVMQFILFFIPVKKGRIAVLNSSGYSGSNPLAFYNYLIEEGYSDVKKIEPFPSSHLPWSDWHFLGSAQFIFGSHASFKAHKNQKMIQFWHGIPLKRMMYMDHNVTAKAAERAHREWVHSVDTLITSSALYETLMGACVGISNDHFERLGFPRNDNFYINDQLKNQRRDALLNVFDQAAVNAKTRIIFYLPTFRLADSPTGLEGKLASGNLFGIDDFDATQLEKTLAEQNIVIIAKLHPLEEKIISLDQLNKNKHVKLIPANWLAEQGFDLYQFLAATDGLITDYSSVYFDYLLLNRPLGFIDTDLAEYQRTRGFLLEPYERFTPGDKITSFDQLLHFVTTDINRDTYLADRTDLKEILFEKEAPDFSKQVFEKLVKPYL